MIETPPLNFLDVSAIVKKIRDAQTILLSTHKQCDGDGLGSLIALFHSLKKIGKKVRIVSVDQVPSKYNFLEPEKILEVYESPHQPIEETDLALIFDTNDRRLVEPLYTELKRKCKNILFVDHHPILNQGPEPTTGSFIDTRAASTGEITYFIIKSLGIRLDQKIARALYTSIAFDTQIFRYVKGSANSHLICAELLMHEHNPEEIHRFLFATHTKGKINFLNKVLNEVKYYGNGRIAILRVNTLDLVENGLGMDDSRDVIDMIMNITSVTVAAVFREDEPDTFKISLRSKGKIEVLSIAESFSGGGHLYAAGAYITGSFNTMCENLLTQFLQRLDSEDQSPAPVKNVSPLKKSKVQK